MGKKAPYITLEAIQRILPYMYEDNRLCVQIALETGLRVTDVLNLRKIDILSKGRISVFQHKTGKFVKVYIPAKLRDEILKTRPIGTHNNDYVFPGRVHPQTRHRTRQAVNKDIIRAIKASGLQVYFSPHTARKIYAVNAYREGAKIEEIQKNLGHNSKAVTALYALSDLL